jgi:hypothetical protein
MGLRTAWRRHPRWWGSAAVATVPLLVVSLACIKHYAGSASLKQVLADQRVIGTAPAEFIGT